MTRDEAWNEIVRLGEMKLAYRRRNGWESKAAVAWLAERNRQIDKLLAVVFPRQTT